MSGELCWVLCVVCCVLCVVCCVLCVVCSPLALTPSLSSLSSPSLSPQLMALGHVSENPFRIMDEYDVFMDDQVSLLVLVISPLCHYHHSKTYYINIYSCLIFRSDLYSILTNHTTFFP